MSIINLWMMKALHCFFGVYITLFAQDCSWKILHALYSWSFGSQTIIDFLKGLALRPKKVFFIGLDKYANI